MNLHDLQKMCTTHLKYKWNNEKPFKIHTKSKILKTKLMKTGEKKLICNLYDLISSSVFSPVN